MVMIGEGYAKNLENFWLDDGKNLLQSAFKQKGIPAIVLSKRTESGSAKRKTLRRMGTTLFVTDINEQISPSYLNKKSFDGLVAHHLTPDLLKQEGQLFRKHYPDIKGELIAVMISRYCEPEKLAGVLMRATETMEQATIFICTSTRTKQDTYQRLCNSLKKNIAPLGTAEKIHVISYHLNDHRENQYQDADGYNPYIGLIDQTDHIIVHSDSHSILSETLSCGKSVHIYGNGEYSADFSYAEEHGMIDYIHESFNESALKTRKISPVNVTEQIADAIVEKYRKEKQAYDDLKFIRHPLKYIRRKWL
ncbi:MAG: mitochondrial fission ELM1 family protein [Rhodospirillales bacterium]|nr:mitochondrial fission ELM1 family protein [Rhodospirillales bacterium]MCB9995060.1 mitochondrial fission ELM1 family protein [Rhodospirillales bacterium]